MKNKSLKEKFRNNILVRPLYRKVGRKIRSKQLVSINFDNTYKLEGNDFKIRRQIVNNSGEITTKVDILPGVCENDQKYDNNTLKTVTNHLGVNPEKQFGKMLTRAESDLISDNSDNLSKNSKTDKYVQAERIVVLRNVPDTWLRVYPLPALPEETTGSVILRCVACQIGLATILGLWTLIWTFLIHSFEGPYELQVSVDFEYAQNQVVIDLATELRQITPLSPKWREAIEKRIAEERQLTIQAVGRGARVQPGHFWDLPGTFLFAIYVMTALGFGAPVPHTVWGRSSALIYAFIAVPSHIYLMVNASTCLIVNLEGLCCRRTKTQNGIDDLEERITSGRDTGSNYAYLAKIFVLYEYTSIVFIIFLLILLVISFHPLVVWKRSVLAIRPPLVALSFSFFDPERSAMHLHLHYTTFRVRTPSVLRCTYTYTTRLSGSESQNCNKNPEILKSSRHVTLRRKLWRVLSLPCAYRCVPLAALAYYGCGAVAFGVLRELPAVDTLMFPLEFTTTGGLEHVVGYVRILYGAYVEGAMVLLSCALATLKRNSTTRVNSVAESYRLFQVERP